MRTWESRRMAGIEKTLIRQMNDLADPSCLNLGLGELGFPTPRSILDHVRNNLGSWRLGYTPNEGLPALREAIASLSPGRASSDQVCVTIGAEEALFAVLMVLVSTGDEVLVPDPGFPAYPSIVKMAGGTPRTYALDSSAGFNLDVRAVEDALSASTKAVIVNHPHNPTGAVYGEDSVRRLAILCRERGVWIISDEVYSELSFGLKPSSPAAYSDACLVVNSLSKSHCLTGWRIGWAVVPRNFIKPLAAFHQLSVTCAPAISQYAALYALRGGADEEMERNRLELARRKDIAIAALRRHTTLPYIEPKGAFYLMVNVGSWRDRLGNSLDIARSFLAREKVVTIPGSAFGERGEGFLRLSFAARPEDIEEGIRRLGRFLSV